MNGIFSLALNYYLSKHRGLANNCYKGVFLNFIESTFAGTFYFLSIYFVDVLHLNLSVAGLIISFYGLGTILGGLISGKLSDKYCSKNISIFSLLVQSIGFLWLIKISTPLLLIMDLFILGFSAYSFITSNYVWVLNHCNNSEEDRLKAINSMTVASNLGIGVSAIAIGELANHSFNYIFFFSGIFLLLSTFLLIFQKKDNKTNFNSEESQFEQIKTTFEMKNTKCEKPSTAVNLVLICLFFTGLIVAQLSTTYSIFLKDRFPYLGIHAFSTLFFISTCLVIIFQNHFVNYFSSANKILTIGFGSFLIGIGMLILNFSYIFPIAIFSCLLYSFGEMIFFSMVQLYLYQKGEEGKKGSSLGKYRMVYASSRFLGPTVGSSVYHYISASTLWYLCGLIGIVFFILCYSYKSLAQ